MITADICGVLLNQRGATLTVNIGANMLLSQGSAGFNLIHYLTATCSEHMW